MTKKHFIAIAELFAAERKHLTQYFPNNDYTAEQELEAIESKIADLCKRFNHDFDYTRFYAASGRESD